MTPEELAAIRERDRQDLDAEKTFANRTWGFFHAANDRGRLLAEVDRLTAGNEELRGALKPLADIPLEEFLKRKPDDPIMGWNDHYLRVRHVYEARAALNPEAKP